MLAQFLIKPSFLLELPFIAKEYQIPTRGRNKRNYQTSRNKAKKQKQQQQQQQQLSKQQNGARVSFILKWETNKQKQKENPQNVFFF
jgi:hypothetical protein